ncbi:MAG: hypothetical protein IPN71_04715 [Fibrobacteres bacterium]|nr:hypothetical protein [Fibrobacterota bacterium]
MQGDALELSGVRTHNLRGVDVSFPRGRWTAICGVSGSGKSSLAFHTLHAESERRWLSTLPAWRRLLADSLARPPLESARGLTPTAALRQESSDGFLGTLASLAGLREPLAALWAAAAVPVSPATGLVMRSHSPDEAADELVRQVPGGKLQTLFGAAGTAKEWMARGFVRGISAGRTLEFSEETSTGPLPELFVVVDRLKAEARMASRLSESVAIAYRHGDGVCHVEILQPDGSTDRLSFSNVPRCPVAKIRSIRPVVGLFSPRAPQGACPVCTGSGGEDSDCPSCRGSGLREESRWFKLGGLSLDELCDLPVGDGLDVVGQSDWSALTLGPCRELVAEVRARFASLASLGLGYLPLSRRARTLSEGEERRARLSALVGSPLSGLTYILDEPATGLHPRDTPRVHALLRSLCEGGATLVVVEHDLSSLRACDHVLETGPGPGPEGGLVVYQGSPAGLALSDTPSGRWLSGRDRLPARSPRVGDGGIVLKGCCGRNLSIPEVRIPLGVLVAVTGVSGAGKSSLLQDTLVPALARHLGGDQTGLVVEGCQVFGALDEVRAVDVGGEWIRSPRSTVATLSGMLDDLRTLFASLPEAKARGWNATRFSPNAKGGRCERCEGLGEERVRLHLLPDAWILCARCQGARFEPSTLEVRWKGLSIAEVLDLSLEAACALFVNHPKLGPLLSRLVQAGLGHLSGGRRAQGLSGGEGLRLRLASAVAGGLRKRVLWVLDEPSRGLHPRDTIALLSVLEGLVASGHGVVFSTHDSFLASRADHLLELGPKAAKEGGRLLYSGPPQGIVGLDCPSSEAISRELS